MPKKSIKIKETKKVEKKVPKKIVSDSESDDEVEEKTENIDCIGCKKKVDVNKDMLYEYCEECNTLLRQCSLKNLLSIFTALDAQMKQLYTDNNLLTEKIKLLENKTSQ